MRSGATPIRLRCIVVLDLLINLSIGLGFALCARDRVRVDGPFATPAFLLVLIYAGISLLPATLYLYWAHAAWSWLYLVDPADVPALAVVPVLVIHVAMLVVGWYGGARLVRSDRGNVVGYATAGGAVLVVVMVLVLSGRLGAYGSFDAFTDGRAAKLFDVKLGYVLIALALGLVVATGYTALELVRDSRRVRAR